MAKGYSTVLKVHKRGVGIRETVVPVCVRNVGVLIREVAQAAPVSDACVYRGSGAPASARSRTSKRPVTLTVEPGRGRGTRGPLTHDTPYLTLPRTLGARRTEV